MPLPIPSIEVYPPRRKGNVWIAGGSIQFGGGDRLLVAAYVPHSLILSAAAMMQSYADAADTPTFGSPDTMGAVSGSNPPVAGPGEMAVMIVHGWRPQGLASWYTGDPSRGAELIARNSLAVDATGRPYPWGKGQWIVIPATWNPAARPVPPPGPRHGAVGAETVERLAHEMTSNAAVKTALDVGEFVPFVGTGIYVSRSAARIANGLRNRHPHAIKVNDAIMAAARAGDPQAFALSQHVERAHSALNALDAADSGDIGAQAALHRLQSDARAGVPDAVQEQYAVEGARDVMAPDYRQGSDGSPDGADDDDGESVNFDPDLAGAAAFARASNVSGISQPSSHSDAWLHKRIRSMAVGCNP